MHKYYISTDSGSQEIEASSFLEAIQEWGEAPKRVKTVVQWEQWLDKIGGYGWVEEDGVEIARVGS